MHRIGSYRFNKTLPDERRTVLIPVSGGVSSNALLHILDQQLQRQRSNCQNRTSYDLHILVVDTSSVLPGGPDLAFLNRIRSRYSAHVYTLEPLAAVFEYDKVIGDSLEQIGIQQDSLIGAVSNEDKLRHVLSRLRSPSSQTDMLDTLLIRLVASFAKIQDFAKVLWGHSDSRLAGKALSSVASGRGGSMPQQICDGPSPWDVDFQYPVRDIFKSELDLFAKISDPPVVDLVIQDHSLVAPTLSIKDTSIDTLLTNYITSQGDKYPSIMANVVRTASKLQNSARDPDTFTCALCGLSTPQENNQRDEKLCFGCRYLRAEIAPIR